MSDPHQDERDVTAVLARYGLSVDLGDADATEVLGSGP